MCALYGEKIPVFFLRDESGAVHVDGGEGLFFMAPEDAKAKLQGLKGADGVKVKICAMLWRWGLRSYQGACA